MEILEQIEQNNANVEALRSKLIVPKKVQLHSGIEGFESPEVFGIYRNTGGKPLGVVGKVFNPMDLNQFLDSIVASCIESGLDENKIVYNEYKGGSKISFSVPLQEYELKESPMKGDVIKSRLMFKTGYDGKTLLSVNYSTLRVWCSNGSAAWDKDIALSFKNTKNNQDKMMVFTESITKVQENLDGYIKRLGKLALKSVTKEDMDTYYLRVFGINRHNYNEQAKRTQNVFDAINAATLIELQNTGDTLYSMLQGTTRWLTNNNTEEELYFSSAANTNQLAHSVAFSMN